MSDTRPRLGVACAVTIETGAPTARQIHVLLGQRGRGANLGRWVLPGGGVELGETWRKAGEREWMEEVGFPIHIAASTLPFHVMEILSASKDEVHAHRVCLCVRAEVAHPMPADFSLSRLPSDELLAVDLFPLGPLPGMDVWHHITAPVRGALLALRDLVVERPTWSPS